MNSSLIANEGTFFFSFSLLWSAKDKHFVVKPPITWIGPTAEPICIA